MKYLRHSHLGGGSDPVIPPDVSTSPQGQTGDGTPLPQVAAPIPTVMGMTRQQWVIMLLVAAVTVILLARKK